MRTACRALWIALMPALLPAAVSAADLASDLVGLARAGATLRQLLQHTAGLLTYARIDWTGSEPPAPDTARYAFLAQPPGRVFEYSNLGYGLVGERLAQAITQRLPREADPAQPEHRPHRGYPAEASRNARSTELIRV